MVEPGKVVLRVWREENQTNSEECVMFDYSRETELNNIVSVARNILQKSFQ